MFSEQQLDALQVLLTRLRECYSQHCTAQSVVLEEVQRVEQAEQQLTLQKAALAEAQKKLRTIEAEAAKLEQQLRAAGGGQVLPAGATESLDVAEPVQLSEDENALLQHMLIPLSGVDVWSVRLRNLLEKGGHEYLGTVAQMTQQSISNTRGYGQQTQRELKELLEKHELCLGLKPNSRILREFNRELAQKRQQGKVSQ